MNINFSDLMIGTFECKKTGETIAFSYWTGNSDVWDISYRLKDGDIIEEKIGIYRNQLPEDATFMGGEKLSQSQLTILGDNKIELWGNTFTKINNKRTLDEQ